MTLHFYTKIEHGGPKTYIYTVRGMRKGYFFSQGWSLDDGLSVEFDALITS